MNCLALSNGQYSINLVLLAGLENWLVNLTICPCNDQYG